MRYGGLRHNDHGLRDRAAAAYRTLPSLIRRYGWMPAGLTLVTAIGAGLFRYPAIAGSQPNEPAQSSNTARDTAPSDVPAQIPAETSTPEQGHQQNSTHITVNGQTYDVPENGQIHDVQADDKSETSVDISNQSSQTQSGATNSNSTSLHISTKSTGGKNP